MRRRHYLASVSGLLAAVLAGCSGGGGDDDDGTGTRPNTDRSGGDDPTETDTSTGGQDGSKADGGSGDADGTTPSGPSEVVESTVEAAIEDDTERFLSLLHPLHPFSGADAGDVSLGTPFDPDVTVEATVETETPSRGELYTSVLGAERAFSGRESQLREILATKSAVLSVTIQERRQSLYTENLWVAATDDSGDWRLLWQGNPPDPTQDLDRRVIDTVRFPDERDVAILTPVETPSPGDVVVDSAGERRAVTALSDRSEPVTVQLDEDGGELTVTAMSEGERTTVHRERYGDRRVVADVTVTQTVRAGIVAQVEFTERLDGTTANVEVSVTRSGRSRTLIGASTGEDGEIESDPEASIGTVGSVRIPVSREYDEVTVALLQDGERTEIHRERIYYANER